MMPKKLKDDCIIEAICEVRFTTNELPEITIGRLSDHQYWKSFSKTRLPIADIPGPIRAVEEQLRYQPILELRNDDNTHLVKVGTNVLSYHNVGKYCGWSAFEIALNKAFNALFESVEDTQINRIGFRYINAITSTRHYISGAKDLKLSIEVAGEKLEDAINLNYLIKNGDMHLCMTRIASPLFVQGQIPKDTSVVVDIDVYTPNNFLTKGEESAKTWTQKAHDFEKEAFFKLIPRAVLEKLEEK